MLKRIEQIQLISIDYTYTHAAVNVPIIIKIYKLATFSPSRIFYEFIVKRLKAQRKIFLYERQQQIKAMWKKIRM